MKLLSCSSESKTKLHWQQKRGCGEKYFTQEIPIWCWFTDEVIQKIIENLYQNFLPG